MLPEYSTEHSAGVDLRSIIDLKVGKRICQMIISKHAKPKWMTVDKLLKTERGDGGFGHKGKH